MRKFLIFPNFDFERRELSPLTFEEFEKLDKWGGMNDIAFDQFLRRNQFCELDSFWEEELKQAKIELHDGEPKIDWSFTYGYYSNENKFLKVLEASEDKLVLEGDYIDYIICAINFVCNSAFYKIKCIIPLENKDKFELYYYWDSGVNYIIQPNDFISVSLCFCDGCNNTGKLIENPEMNCNFCNFE